MISILLITTDKITKQGSLFGVKIKELQSLSKLFLPSNFLVLMTIYSILLQVSRFTCETVSSAKIQNINSTRAYKKVLLIGFSSFSVSCIYALVKTLSNEFSSLSLLRPFERIEFLELLKNELILDKSFTEKSFKVYESISEEKLLMFYRKQLAKKFRNFFVFSNLSTLGLPVEDIDLDYILKIGKFFYNALGFSEKEFDFLLFKEAFFSFQKYDTCYSLHRPKTLQDCLRLLVFLELKNVLLFDVHLYFNDPVFFCNSFNLTRLEYNLGFIKRFLIKLPSQKRLKFSEINFNELIIKTALTQRNFYYKKLNSFFFFSFV